MASTKVKIDLPITLLSEFEDNFYITFYEKVNRNSLFNSDIKFEKSNDRLLSYIEINPAIYNLGWFRLMVSSGGAQHTVFQGAPRAIISTGGGVSFEIDEFIRFEEMFQTIEKRALENIQNLPKTDIDFAKGVLGEDSNPEKFNDLAVFRAAKNFNYGAAISSKTGFESARDDTRNKRLEICKKCEFWNAESFGGTGKCEKCGCSTQLKINMSNSSCPLDPPKWVAE